MESSRTDALVTAIEDLIFSGEFADGDRLDETRLADQFGVSRTPIREALQRLSQSGLVEAIPRRGVFVRDPSPVELMDMFEVMAELEAACGRLAAARITDDALSALEAANDGCRDAVTHQDAESYYAANERFHHIIYQQSGNGFLEQETRRLHRRLKPFRRMQLRLRGRLPQSMSEHEDILSALRSGAADRAAQALREHVAIQGEKFHLLMRARG